MRILILLLTILPSFLSAQETCIESPYENTQTFEQSEVAAIYGEIAAALRRFPSLANAIAAQSPQLCVSSQMGNAHGYLDVEQNRIYLRQELPGDLKAGILLHEIRHLDQHVLGACPSDSLAMDEYALATFALEADASAISLLIAWDMKEQGNSGVWFALSSWESQKDIAARFAEVMAASGSAEAAASAAFEQWFASDMRHDLYYRSICSAYLDRQDASKALSRYQLIPSDYFSVLCKLPDGKSYRCSEPMTKAR
jgi:hypothetical protein